jgi:hypothetical protein
MPFPIHSKKTVIFTSKKVASASIRKLVHAIEFTDKDSDTWRLSGEGREMQTRRFKPKYDPRVFGEYRKVAIIRDPIERVHSCFRHRVGNTKTLLRDIAPAQAEATRRLEAAGLEVEPTFTYFVENADRYCALNTNLARHLDSQQIALGPLDWYDDVIKVGDLSYLSGELGVPMPHLHQTAGRRGLTPDEVRAAYKLTADEYAYLAAYFPTPDEVLQDS